jgi:predicted tellurium resistance membrane protein TerC
MKTLQQLYDNHPNLVLWAGLALGMVAILLVAARSVGFTLGQWAALLAATVALAGLCVWIISWESDESNESEG